MCDRLPRIVDHIGETTIFHGERDDSEACLCGEPYYLHCPEYLDGIFDPGADPMKGDWANR